MREKFRQNFSNYIYDRVRMDFSQSVINFRSRGSKQKYQLLKVILQKYNKSKLRVFETRRMFINTSYLYTDASKFWLKQSRFSKNYFKSTLKLKYLMQILFQDYFMQG